GVALFVVAAFQVRKALTGAGLDDIDTRRLSATQRTWLERVTKLGLSARAVTFALMGWFLVQAGLQHDPSEAGGLGKALLTLASQSYGWLLLGLVAVGLVCYGVYCLARARFMALAMRAHRG